MNLGQQFEAAGKMPALKHTQSSDEWIGPGESAAVDWLCAQPEIRAAVFMLARNFGFVGCVDREGGMWCGNPEMRSFVPYSDDEVRAELAEPKRLYQLMAALVEKHRRPADQWALRLGLLGMANRGVIAIKECPGYRGQTDKWYGLRAEDFEKTYAKAGAETKKARLRVEHILYLLEGEGPMVSRDIVAKMPEFSRSTIYARLKSGVQAGLIAVNSEPEIPTFDLTEAGRERVKTNPGPVAGAEKAGGGADTAGAVESGQR